MTDFDGDGMLDLILSHGESMAQPISVFRGTRVSQAGNARVVPVLRVPPSSVSLLPPPSQGSSNNWLRVIPRTRFGAFARGAKVTLFTRHSGAHLRIIDGGSGYLCEMEPVAHFGLGELRPQGAASAPSTRQARGRVCCPGGLWHRNHPCLSPWVRWALQGCGQGCVTLPIPHPLPAALPRHWGFNCPLAQHVLQGCPCPLAGHPTVAVCAPPEYIRVHGLGEQGEAFPLPSLPPRWPPFSPCPPWRASL